MSQIFPTRPMRTRDGGTKRDASVRWGRFLIDSHDRVGERDDERLTVPLFGSESP